MTFGITMMAINLLIPFLMIVFGYVFRKRPPKKINHLLGYRTTMSMKNQETWEYAHHHCGTIWQRVGLCMLIVSFLFILFAIGKGTQAVDDYSPVAIVVQTAVLVGSVIPTEVALRKKFDRNGKSR